jgi:hypothetical protein
MPEWRSQAYILAEKAAGDDWSAFRYDDQGIANPSERRELIAAIAVWLTATRQWTESFIGPITAPRSDSAE